MNTIFETDEFGAYATRWNTRLKELSRRGSYYDGSAYDKLNLLLRGSWLEGFLRDRLYTNIRPLYLFLARSVDVDVGLVPGDWRWSADADPASKKAAQQVARWSRWGTDGVLYIHYGATYGPVGLKISDLRDRGQVVIKPCNPTTFMLVEGGTYGGDDAPVVAFQVETRLDETGAEFEYAEVITAEWVRTFKNGTPQGFDRREAEYQNELGFVPLVETEHIRNGQWLGENTFQKSIPLLNELNELGTYLADIIQKHVEPQWAAFGAEPTDLEKSGDNVWFFRREGSSVVPVVAPLDIKGVLEFVKEIRTQVESSLPELGFDEIRKKNLIATATVELQLMELFLKIQRIRPNYDDGLERALVMAGRAAASMGLKDISVLVTKPLQLDAERRILPQAANLEALDNNESNSQKTEVSESE